MPVPVREPRAVFDEAALRTAMAAGRSTVSGQVFGRTVGGDVKIGAGVEVRMIAQTEYATDCLRYIKFASTTCFDRIRPYLRSTITDAEGRFVFSKVRPGTYQLETTLTWGVPTPSGVAQTGGEISGTARVVTDGEAVSVMLAL